MLESDQALNLWMLNGDEMFNHLFIFRIWDHICNIFCLCWYCRLLPMTYRASSTWMEWIMRVYVVDKSSGLTKWCRSFTEFEYWIYSKILIKVCRKFICRLSSASLAEDWCGTPDAFVAIDAIPSGWENITCTSYIQVRVHFSMTIFLSDATLIIKYEGVQKWLFLVSKGCSFIGVSTLRKGVSIAKKHAWDVGSRNFARFTGISPDLLVAKWNRRPAITLYCTWNFSSPYYTFHVWQLQWCTCYFLR